MSDPQAADSVKTPVFVRFSTVVGSRGSTDLARDVRGFAVKFYTEEGNYDLVGNNIPVFFIQFPRGEELACARKSVRPSDRDHATERVQVSWHVRRTPVPACGSWRTTGRETKRTGA